ncbi:MAG: hypothetical protein PHI31_12665 [Desulfuromonadaceae bacterium]|nr:hypothetical protein [Desulfuromonadaceae bacterium]
METTAIETARALIGIYNECFANENYSHFRILWPELRSIAAVSKLSDQYLREVSQELNKSQFTLIPLDNFLVVAQEFDFSQIRFVPPRLVDQFMTNEKSDSTINSPEYIQPKWKPRFRMHKKRGLSTAMRSC